MAIGRRAVQATLAAGLVAATITIGSAEAAAPDQVAGVVVSGLAGQFLKIGVASSPVTFSGDGTGETPAKYEYWVNAGKHKTVKADRTGSVIVSFTFTTHRNELFVEGVGTDGTVGGATVGFYLADGVAAAAEKDSNGDGVPDLLAVGDPSGLGSGLWLAAGARVGSVAGRVRTPAVNVGANGLGDGDPAYFDGSNVILGNFLGDNLQDVLVYFVNGPKAGVGVILPGTGDGSVETGGDFVDAGSAVFEDINGDTPIDLANGYDSAGLNNVIPDFIGISGSEGDGYHLAYYPLQADAPLDIALGELTANLTPTGGTDWQNWQLFSTVLTSGTAIYLRNATTGTLYLWESVHFTDNGDFTGTISYIQYKIAENWNTGATFSTIETTDFNNDGVPDLWTVTPSGIATAYVVSALSTATPAHIVAKTPQDLS
jgi:hypothetical protein